MRRRCQGQQNRGWYHEQFRDCGYKITPSRDAILDVLTKTTKHLSAEEIYEQIRKVHPSGGLATVYRTLELLTELGIVYKFDFGDNRARYELAQETAVKDHHHHLVCMKCYRIIEYTDFIDDEIELLKRTEKSLSKRYNFEISKHIIQFYGLCDRCKSKK
ncbi:MAG: Fur family transcriptional regulator [Candidatus Susulua stagnicola]|nr:Fur family transcriptional regulator [Candidatus Susulua stagnicola]